MLLTITSLRKPAGDLGWILHKHPDKAQAFDVGAGKAHVFYTENTEERCTAALHLELDPIELVRGPSRNGIDAYVNDRTYAASSFLAVAMGRVFGTALSGTCKGRPELVSERMPLEARVVPISCRGGSDFARRLFEPLGWSVEAADAGLLDPRFPEWGKDPYLDLTVRGTGTVQSLLRILQVLVPVMDARKHYWVGEDEAEKLLRMAEDWLADHPMREAIARRYLKNRRSLADGAMKALGAMAAGKSGAEDETALMEDGVQGADEIEAGGAGPAPAESGGPGPAHAKSAEPGAPRLADLRIEAIAAELGTLGARRVADLGCGSGPLLARLMKDSSFERLIGVDASPKALDAAARRLHLDTLAPSAKARIKILQGALTYRDRRLDGMDAFVLCEVIEHVDAERLDALEEFVFGAGAAPHAVVTTPNREHNAAYGMEDGALRHPDHRFEWTRGEFQDWAEGVAERRGRTVRFFSVGGEHPEFGASTQGAVFSAGPSPAPCPKPAPGCVGSTSASSVRETSSTPAESVSATPSLHADPRAGGPFGKESA